MQPAQQHKEFEMTDLKLTIVPFASDSDVRIESKFPHLRSNGFVRGVTAMDQWFILVGDAWKESRLPMNELMRDYLTTMLDRFTRRADLIEQLSVFDFVPHLLGLRRIDSVCIQDVADMSLQYVAFFPGRSGYRHEPRSLEYTASIGETLYQQLSRETEGKDDWFSCAYAEMGKAFGQAVMVLRAMNPAFGYQRTIAAEAKKKKDLFFQSDVEVGDVRKIFNHVDGMYFEQPIRLDTTIN